jgi:hypothetical protein
MAYYKCSACAAPTFPFGPGHRQRLVDEFGIAQSCVLLCQCNAAASRAARYTLPIDAMLSQAGDAGQPVALSRSSPAAAATFDELAAGVVRQVAVLSRGAAPLAPLVEFHSSSSTVTVTPHEGSVAVWTFAQLRAACLGAGNDKKRQALGVRPVGMRARGNYAVGISWSDGHESIYPYRPAPNNNTAFVY